MSTCCEHNRDAGRFFGWFARRYRQRFARKGLEPSQKQLMRALTSSGFSDAIVLEIGCGTGYLHQRLLQAGAASAVGVDLSAKMLDEARALAREQRLSERTDYRHGDFVELGLSGGYPLSVPLVCPRSGTDRPLAGAAWFRAGLRRMHVRLVDPHLRAQGGAVGRQQRTGV
jgi:SAM-dependent methyltransferase